MDRNNFGRYLDHYWQCNLLVGTPFAWLLHLWCNTQGRKGVGFSLVCRNVVVHLFSTIVTCTCCPVILVGISCQQFCLIFVSGCTTAILKKFFNCLMNVPKYFFLFQKIFLQLLTFIKHVMYHLIRTQKQETLMRLLSDHIIKSGGVFR